MFVRATVLVLCFLGASLVYGAPTGQSKRLSQQALMRLILQRGGQADYQAFLQQHTVPAPVRRNSESQPQRRSFDMGDDDFQNCFLSPVQCMLPTQNK